MDREGNQKGNDAINIIIMKKLIYCLISLCFGFVPQLGKAQQNIVKAFDAIINCPQVKIIDKHTLQKNPETGVKTGQADQYKFTLPIDKMDLVKNAVDAIKTDSEMAYDIEHGHTSSEQKGKAIYLAVGEGDGISIYLPDSEYIYAYFLAPKSEDPEGNNRYAYGIIYKVENGVITGEMAITYSTTLAYRQEKNIERQKEIIRSWNQDYSNNMTVTVLRSGNQTNKSWFESVMSCLQSMSQANGQTRIALATRAYELIKNIKDYPDVTVSDKETVTEILKAMIADKKYSETILNQLLSQCLVTLN